MKHWMVVLALLLTAQSAAAQWRPDSSTGGLSGPKRYLTVASSEGNARLLVWCSEPVTFQLDMDRRLGIFDFYGTDYVFLKARFLPDTMIYPTTWNSRAGSGYGSTADNGRIDWVGTSLPPDSAERQAWEDRHQATLLDKLTHAPAFQIELVTYGRGDHVATFKIPNHDVLELFAARCPQGTSGMVPTGNEVFMEAIVEEKPAVLSGPRLQFPELLRQAGIEGRVLVQAIVDTLGRVEPNSVKVLQSPNPGFDQSATNYVLKALFRPARVHGRAVRVLIQIPVDFRKY